jgi:hypothetical protein
VGELDGVGMAQLVEREQLRGGAHPSTDPAPGSRSSSVRVSASLMRRPGAPEQHDQSSQAGAVDTVAGLANDGDDLLHGGRIRWERNPLLGGFCRINGTKLAIVGRVVVDRRPASALGGAQALQAQRLAGVACSARINAARLARAKAHCFAIKA